jgi:hypothetical protein
MLRDGPCLLPAMVTGVGVLSVMSDPGHDHGTSALYAAAASLRSVPALDGSAIWRSGLATLPLTRARMLLI